jgi:phage terminase large subunit GpA-like protein
MTQAAAAAAAPSPTRLAVRAAIAQGLTPPPLLTVSQWAEAHRVLAGKAASEPGPWRNSRTPYLAKVMDALSATSRAEIVVFVKGSQIGATEAGNNWIGYSIHHVPGPILAVCPTVELAKRASRQRIDTLIDATPCLRGLVAPARERDSGNTLLSKDFPGGVLALTGANSAVGLRSMPARDLFLDEVDAFPADADGEGDPVFLARRATRTFQRRRVFMVSTPKRAGLSRIMREFEACEQAWKFHVPCPLCGHRQELVWERLRYDVPASAGNVVIPDVRYSCAGCSGLIPEHAKTEMLGAGAWAPLWDRGNRSVGFHLSALYSPVGWLSWGEAAAMYERARARPEDMQVFTNTVLGLPYAEPSEAPDWEVLYARREGYTRGVVPAGGRFLTAGVDHQDDRVEVTLVAWGREKRSWVVDHKVIPCPATLEARRAVLDDLLGADWPCAGGGGVPLWCLAVDSGAYTQDVYAWARGHLGPSYGGGALRVRQPRTVMVCKGMDRSSKMLYAPDKVSAEERKRGLKLVGLGSSGAKRQLYLWLRLRPATSDERAAGIEDPYGFCHFPELEEEYFRQLTAEQLVRTQNPRGYDKEEWVKMRARNEALDCWVLAHAAAVAVGLDWYVDRDWKRLEAIIPEGLLATPAAVPRGVAALPAAGPTATVLPPAPRAAARPMRRAFLGLRGAPR